MEADIDVSLCKIAKRHDAAGKAIVGIVASPNYVSKFSYHSIIAIASKQASHHLLASFVFFHNYDLSQPFYTYLSALPSFDLTSHHSSPPPPPHSR